MAGDGWVFLRVGCDRVLRVCLVVLVSPGEGHQNVGRDGEDTGVKRD